MVIRRVGLPLVFVRFSHCRLSRRVTRHVRQQGLKGHGVTRFYTLGRLIIFMQVYHTLRTILVCRVFLGRLYMAPILFSHKRKNVLVDRDQENLPRPFFGRRPDVYLWILAISLVID